MKKVLLALVVASAVAFAGQGDYKSEVSFHVGGVKPEGNLDLENELNIGLRYGRYLDDLFFDMIEVGAEMAPNMGYTNSNEETDVNRYFVNIIKEYTFNENAAYYALAGFGYEDYENPMYDNEDDGYFNYGVGIKQWITDRLALKFEGRHAISFEGNSNLFYSIGFVIPFEKRKKVIPMTKIEPDPEPIMVKEEPKPVVKEEPKPVVSVDDDKDGVLNKDDKCPETKMGKIVNSDGCLKIVRLHVNFAYDKADVSQEYMPRIKEVVAFLNENSDYSVAVDGHTDSRGSEEYNLALSVKRANAVANKLIEQGIDKSKISVNGFGETNPIATNKTQEGRAQNRRVDTSFSK